MCFFVIFVVLLERLVLVNAEHRLFRWRADTPQRGRRWRGGGRAAATGAPAGTTAEDAVRRDSTESAVASVDSGAATKGANQ
jgi:NitT/TauT family transport system permease protein